MSHKNVRKANMPIFLSAVSFCFVVPAVGCQESSAPYQQATKVVRHIHEPVFGDRDLRVTHQFEVVNDTRETVFFDAVDKSCGCAEATLDQLSLEHGQKTLLRVEARFGNQPSHKRIYCRLKTRAREDWVYELDASVYPNIFFEGMDYLSFGDVEPKASLVRYVTACTYVPPGGDPPVLRPAGEDQLLKYEVEKHHIDVLPDGVRCRVHRIKLELKAPENAGRRSLVLPFESTFGKDRKHVEFTVDYTVKSVFVVEPAFVSFGRISTGVDEPSPRQVTIQCRDERTYEVLRVESPHPAVKVEVNREGKRGHVLRLEIVPSFAHSDSYWGEVVVETTHPLQRSIKIPVSWLGQVDS